MNSSDEPDTLVILSTYNGSNYISECLNSVAGQTYQKFKILIVDDCSTDNTFEIINDFKFPISCKYEIIQNKKNSGLYKNINNTILYNNNSKIKYIKLIGQDDILENNCLEEIVSLLEKDVTIMSGWCYDRHIDETGAYIPTLGYNGNDHIQHVLSPRDAILDMARWGCLSSNISNLFFRRELFDKVGLFREDLKSADFEFLSRAQLQFNSIRFTKRLVRIRSHADQWGKSRRDFDNHILGNISIFNGLINQNIKLKIVPDYLLKEFVCRRLCHQELWWATKHIGRSISIRNYLDIFKSALYHFGIFKILSSMIYARIQKIN
jgi:glycosyltransferase involved in cell wall biosynthesis